MVVVEESAAFIAGCQARSMGHWCSKDPTPHWLSGKVLKDRVRERVAGCVHYQLVHNSLIGWWWGNWKSTISTFWFQSVWGLHVCGQHAFNFFHLVGVSVSAKQLGILSQNIWLKILFTALEEELKVLDFVLCLPWLLSFVSAFSHFSDQIFSLELRERIEG